MMLLPGIRLSWPTPWIEVFGRQAPLIVEIGFGNGQFLVDLAHKRPLANVIGLEISLPSLRKGTRKLEKAGLTNARVLQSDALLFLWALCEPDSLQEIYINFPDPWPKEGHHHRRLINTRFLHLLATRLVAGGTLDIATDHADYAQVISHSLINTPYFDSRFGELFATEDTERLRTKYELKAIAEGRACHYYKWQRNAVPAPQIFPIPQELPMPHAVLQSPLTLADISRQFTPAVIQLDATHVKLMEMFQSTRDGKLMVEAYVNEEPIAQRVGLTIRQRRDGSMVISLHEIGFPRSSSGVQAVVKYLTEWIMSLHPDTQLLRHNLPIP